MRYEGSPVKAPPAFKKKDGTARTKQLLERTYSVKVRVEELEGFLGLEDVDVDFRRILKEARDERGRKIFETFSSNDLSFLVAERSRRDKYKRAPWRQDSSASASDGWRREVEEQLIVSWNPVEKRGIDAVEDYLESCAQVIVDIDVVERLRRPENLEVSMRYVLKHATSRRRRIAFENLAKEMLRYLDHCNDVKGVHHRIARRSRGVPVQFGISIQQVAQQAMNENGQKIFEIFWREKKNCVLPAAQVGKYRC